MNPLKLLIVDDTAEWRNLLSELIPSLVDNVHIVEADDGEDAVQKLAKSGDFDLIISDYTMPNGTGASVYKYLRDRGMNIPFILFTALPNYNLKHFEGESFVGVASKTDLGRLQKLVMETATSLGIGVTSALQQ